MTIFTIDIQSFSVCDTHIGRHLEMAYKDTIDRETAYLYSITVLQPLENEVPLPSCYNVVS